MTQQDLEKVRKLNDQLICARSRYEILAADIATSRKAPDGMPSAVTNATSSPTEEKGIKLAEAAKKYRRKEQQLKRAKNELREKLTMEEQKEKNVLLILVIEYRAILLYDWKKIAKSFNGRYTEDYLRQLYHRYKSKLPEK